MTYNNPVRIFVSKIFKFSDVIIFYLFNGLERGFSDFHNTCDQFYPTDQKAKNFHLSVLLIFKLFQFVS